MKKALIAALALTLVFSMVGCGGKDSAPATDAPANQTTSEQAPTEAEAVPQNQSKEWPVQFKDWGIPTLASATVSAVEDRSATQEGMTQGVNIVVNLKDVSKDAFDGYCADLLSKGFADNGTSLPGVMMVYEKKIDGGILKMTLSYSESGTTVIANNSAVAAEKAVATGGSTQWPESMKEIPAFDNGHYTETVDMGGGMYALSFKNVTEADLDGYRNTLLKAGFQRQEGTDSEGYALFKADIAYSVGFALAGDKLQVILASGTM